MPNGGARPGAGAPLGNRNRAKKPMGEPAAVPSLSPRPRFESGRDFALWALNAGDDETPMEVKIRAMQALISLEAKATAEPAKKPAAAAPDDEGGTYTPRKVRSFGVVPGGR